MPNCFRLYPNGSTEPAILQHVDAELCKHFGAEVHQEYWLEGWYNVIGFLIACKNDCDLGSDKLRREVAAWFDNYPVDAETVQRLDNMLNILRYLEEHYTSDAWVEIGRRA